MEKLNKKIRDIIIAVLYEYQCPFDIFNASYYNIREYRNQAIHFYRSDYLFHRRVNKFVYMIITAIEEELRNEKAN